MWRFECLKIINATKAAEAAMRRRGVAMAWIAGLTWLFAIVSSRIRASVSACRLRPAPGLSRGGFHRNTRDSNNPTAFDFDFTPKLETFRNFTGSNRRFSTPSQLACDPYVSWPHAKRNFCFPKTKIFLDNWQLCPTWKTTQKIAHATFAQQKIWTARLHVLHVETLALWGIKRLCWVWSFLTIKLNIHLAVRKLAKYAVALGRMQALPCVFKTTKFTNLKTY